MKKSYYLIIIFVLTLIIAFFLGMITGNVFSRRQGADSEELLDAPASDAPVWTPAPETPTPDVPEPTPTDEPAETPQPTPEATENPEPTPTVAVDFSALKASLDSKFSVYASKWVVYVEDLESGVSFTSSSMGLTASTQMTAASVIKLFVAGAVYDASVQSGAMPDEQTVAEIRKMLSESDNDATNNLIRVLGNGDEILGMETVNGFISRMGCTGSKLNRLMLTQGEENLVTAADCATVLRSIYNGTFVNSEVSSVVLEMLRRQQRISKIPSGVLGYDGVSSANKTGELESTENDVALIFTPNGDYIICILASEILNKDDAILTFGQVSKEVCEFYMEQSE